PAAPIRERDLRWGVTQTMAQDGGAVGVCLNGVAECFPYFLGIVGHRCGWQPEPEAVAAYQELLPGDLPHGFGLTGLEIAAAAKLVQSHARTLPVLLRDLALSEELGHAVEEMGLFKDWMLSHPNLRVIPYRSLEEFAELAFEAMATQLSEGAAQPQRLACSAALPRRQVLQTLNAASKPGASLILTGPEGCGLSWIAKAWARQAEAQRVLDGRRLSLEANEATVLPPQTGLWHRIIRWLRSLFARAMPRSARSRTVYDHFEAGFRTEAHASLAALAGIPKIHETRLVVTRNARLLQEAQSAGWRIVNARSPNRDEILAFSATYLAGFGKRLEPSQVNLLAYAPWLLDIRLTRIVLDELRRFGSMETLSERLESLVALPSHHAVLGDIMASFKSVLPAVWAPSIEPMLLAMSYSLRGLSELDCRAIAALSVDQPEAELLPSHLWTSFRQAFGAAISDQSGRVDIGSDGAKDYTNHLAETSPELRIRAKAAFAAWLQTALPEQQALETPRFALSTGSTQALAHCLQDTQMVGLILDQGEVFLEGWLETLPADLQQQTLIIWETSQAQFLPQHALPLGLMCLRVSDNSLGAALVQRAATADATRPMAELALALLHKDTDVLSRAASGIDWSTGHPKPEDTSAALFVLTAIAEGLLEVETTDLKCVQRAIPLWARRSAPDVAAQLWQLLGQISLTFAAWREAARCFERAEGLCRQTGNASALIVALERRSTACMAFNSFKQARRSAQDAKDLARQMGLLRLEGLAIERLIEIEIATARFPEADQLALQYLERSRNGVGSAARARELNEKILVASSGSKLGPSI
ncbi:MAG: hypothetical protein AAGF13_07325, partial [Pseudomonadota bacterium]